MSPKTKYKILTFFVYGYFLLLIFELIGLGFYLEPLNAQATLDMSGKNPAHFNDLKRSSVYSEEYDLTKLEFQNQEKTWCKAKNLHSLMYVPALNSWIWTRLGDRVFRPFQKDEFHSYEAKSWSCSTNSFLVLFWRIEYAIKTGKFGVNSPMNQ